LIESLYILKVRERKKLIKGFPDKSRDHAWTELLKTTVRSGIGQTRKCAVIAL